MISILGLLDFDRRVNSKDKILNNFS